MRDRIWRWIQHTLVAIVLFGVDGRVIPPTVAGETLPRLVDPRAAEVAAWSLQVMQTGSGQPRDLSVSGTGAMADGTPVSIRFWAMGRDRSRAEMTIDSRLQFVSVSGQAGFRQRNGVRQDLPLWVSLYGRPDVVPVFSRLREWSDASTNLEYLGEEDVDGRLTHRIRLWASPRDGRPAHLEEWISEYEVFVDVQTGLVAKTVGYIFSPEIIENRSPVETYYSDWRVDGTILAPHRVERWVSGQFDSEWALSSVRVNSGVSASLFQ